MAGGLGCTLLIRTDCFTSENSESHSINSGGFYYKMHLHTLNQDAIIKVTISEECIIKKKTLIISYCMWWWEKNLIEIG